MGLNLFGRSRKSLKMARKTNSEPQVTIEFFRQLIIKITAILTETFYTYWVKYRLVLPGLRIYIDLRTTTLHTRHFCCTRTIFLMICDPREVATLSLRGLLSCTSQVSCMGGALFLSQTQSN